MEGILSLRRGGMPMVTYDSLFLFGSLIVAIIALVINIAKKKYTATPSKVGYLFLHLLGLTVYSVAFLLLL